MGIRVSLLCLCSAPLWATAAIAQTAPVQPTDTTAATVPLPEHADTNSATATDAPDKGICDDDNTGPAWIDRLHSRLYRLTCSSASWFDGLFGNRRYDQEYRESHGSAIVGAKWSQRDNVHQVLRFHARVNLPQTSNKLNAFIGRSNRDDFVSESTPDTHALPAEFADRSDDQVFAGLGFRGGVTEHGAFDSDLGVRLDLPLDPYVKGSYRYETAVGDHDLVRLRETIFWQRSERLGTTALAEWDHVFNEKHLVRWTNSGTFTQETAGMRWYSVLTWYHSISNKRAFAYQAAANGSTDLQVPLSDYGVAVTYRQRTWREWLILELRTGVDWPRYALTEARRYNLNAGIAFELRFGEQ